MVQIKSWRELLGMYIANPQERQQIAAALGVRPITLTRWVSGETVPRPQNMRQLVTALSPQHRDTFLASLEMEDPGMIAGLGLKDEAGPDEAAMIPSEFYMRVLQTRASMPRDLRYSALTDLILQEALKHLDPHRLGIGISIARCLPSFSGGPVRSLLTDMGRGSPPWGESMEHDIMLLGAESLAGYSVTSGRLVVIGDLHASDNVFPASLGMWEKSAAAAPIAFEGRVAGSLLISSTQVDYFGPVRTRQLVGSYADLIALALDSDQFYDPECIQLGLFPMQQEQQTILTGFRQRLLQNLKQAADRKQYINVIQAEQLAWQQIEEELLQSAHTRASQSI